MAVSQLNMLSDVWAADAIHIPKETMGEIDAMSLLEAQADSLTAFSTFTPLTYYNLESPSVRTLFSRCNSAHSASTPAKHHRIFLDVASLISDIIVSFSIP